MNTVPTGLTPTPLVKEQHFNIAIGVNFNECGSGATSCANQEATYKTTCTYALPRTLPIYITNPSHHIGGMGRHIRMLGGRTAICNNLSEPETMLTMLTEDVLTLVSDLIHTIPHDSSAVADV